MERTESSRLMRGAREIFYEYILELRGRMEKPSRPRRGMHVTAGEYCEITRVMIYADVVFALYSVRQTMRVVCEIRWYHEIMPRPMYRAGLFTFSRWHKHISKLSLRNKMRFS